MKSLLHTLHDNESILLLYLFDELPADDRAEVEAMLAGDANLRAELELLSTANEQINSALEQADAAGASSISSAMAQRQASRAIDQWNARRMLTKARETSMTIKPRNRKWLAYSSGIAAAILVACLIYRGVSSDDADRLASRGTNTPYWTQQEHRVLDLFPEVEPEAVDPSIAMAQPADNTDMLQKSLDPSEEILNDSLKHVDLSAAERELNAVAQLSDPVTINGGLNFE